jgi:hypothetical protein
MPSPVNVAIGLFDSSWFLLMGGGRGVFAPFFSSPLFFLGEKMHDKKEWNPKHFDLNYYEHSENTPYGGFLVEYTWENFQSHAFMKMDFIKRHFSIFNPKSILFGGCAKGFEVRAAKECGYDAYGIDISEYALSHVEPSVKGRCVRGSIVDMSVFKDNEFDLFASFDVWHTIHPEDRLQAAKEVSRVAKRGVLIRTGFNQFQAVRKMTDTMIDPEFNETYDGNPAYQDSIWLFAHRFELEKKFRLFFAPAVWDRDYFIWYCMCRTGVENDMLVRTYGANGGAFRYD